MTKLNNKYNFTLCNIDTNFIHNKYGISLVGGDHDKQNITKLSDISTPPSNVISYLDDSRKLHSCDVSMINFNKQFESKNILYKCFWCRSHVPSNMSSIGCPIKYKPHKIIKAYQNTISKVSYTIEEDITNSRIDNLNDSDLTIEHNDCYVTDGIFCSFNCCLAYINDNNRDSTYKHSKQLLFKLYYTIHNNQDVNITPAPHWRKLIEYGGDLTIKQFRDNFNVVEFTNRGFINSFKSSGIMFEKQMKLNNSY